jgi:hypothetical protein
MPSIGSRFARLAYTRCSTTACTECGLRFWIVCLLALDDGEYANQESPKIAMLDCIVDAGSTGTNNWISKLSELLTHVHGGTLHVDALHYSMYGYVNVDNQVPESVAKAPAHHSMGEPVD